MTGSEQIDRLNRVLHSRPLCRVDAFRAGLRDHGYIEGKNIAIEIRSADGTYDRLP